MKKTICFLLVLCSMVLSPLSALCASVNQDAIDNLLSAHNYVDNTEGVYSNATYNPKLNSIVFEVAYDGLAEIVIEYCDEKNYDREGWDETKDLFFTLYSSYEPLLSLYGLKNVSIVLCFLNDDVYIRQDYSNALYNLLFVIKDGEVVFDIVEEMHKN